MSVPDVLPPSPPNTSHRERERMSLPFPAKPATSTPDDSPSSFPPSSGAASRRRVEFSPWTNVLDAPTSDSSTDTSGLKALPKSRDCASTTKSILKPTSDTTAFGLDGTEDVSCESHATMESIVKQLGSNDRSASIDAYHSLAYLIRCHDELTEEGDVKHNIATILRYIKRDLSLQTAEHMSPSDINLTTQALKICVIFVWSDYFSPMLTDDFRIYVLDRAINVLAENSAPKSVIVHFMHLIATQNFRPMMLTSGTRTAKLLEALREITNHVPGKGVLSERLMIYQRLLEQAKPIMKLRANLWLREVLAGLSSSVRDIRDKSVSVCTKACAAFPASQAVSQAAREALTEQVNDSTMGTILIQKLEKLLKIKDDAAQVPQIWALVMLLCNSSESPLDAWSPLRDWLKVIQRCFNAGDVSVRSAAFPAWNRFIHITKPHSATDSMVSMLLKPIIAQVERAATNASSKGTRPVALSSYCFLLYYGFRPAASPKQLTRAWNEYVVKVATSKFLSMSSANADFCCRIFIAMFWRDTNTSKIWNENRAHDNRLMDPDELPMIDCKWVRSKSTAILEIFRLVFKYSSWGLQHSELSFVARSWRSFLCSVREASSKEVKQSFETKKAISGIMELIFDNAKAANEDQNASAEGDVSVPATQRQLLSRMTLNVLGSTAVLEALHPHESTMPLILLEEILIQSSKDLTAMPMKLSQRNTAGPSADNMNRCLDLLDGKLSNAFSSTDRQPVNILSLLAAAARIVKQWSVNQATCCLIRLSPSLTMILHDSRSPDQNFAGDSSCLHSWLRFSESVIDKFRDIPSQSFCELDSLFAAALLSSNAHIARYCKTAAQKMGWVKQSALFGPQMKTAMATIEPNSGGKLSNAVMAASAADVSFASEQTGPTSFYQSLSATVPETNEHATELYPSVLLNDRVDEAEVISKTCTSALTTPESHQSQLQQHQQISCLPGRGNAGLITDYSPFDQTGATSRITAMHQPVDCDQFHTERGITFADLRSSPQSRASQGSRATSVDCELARKAAALGDAPSTPSPGRQHETIDEAEIPSPTPRSRHLIAQTEDIDIPLSPSSVLDYAGPECATEEQAAVLNVVLGSANQVENSNIGQNDPFITSSPLSVTSEDQKAKDNGEITLSGECSGSQTGIWDDYANESTRNIQNESSDKGGFIPNSDEVDELTASQLSQDLNRHMAEEVRVLEPTVSVVHQARKSGRKRKRAQNKDGSPTKRMCLQNSTTVSRPSPTSDSVEVNEVQKKLVSQARVNAQSSPQSSPRRTRSMKAQESARKAFGLPSTLLGAKTGRPRSRKLKHTPDGLTGEVELISQEPEQADLGSECEIKMTSPVSESFTTSGGEEDIILDVTEEQLADDPVGRYREHATTEVDKGISPKSTTTTPLSHPAGTDITTALRKALEGLKNEQTADIDLRVIDDLCFQIRFQAQELARQKQ